MSNANSEQVTEKDFGRYSELLLLNIILFLYHFFRTHFVFLFKNKLFTNDLGIPARTVYDVTPAPVGYTRPLTFLVVNCILLLVAFPVVFDHSVPSMFTENGLLQDFGAFLESLIGSVRQLKTYESFVLVVPIILLVSLYSILQAALARALHWSSVTFEQLMCINSYGIGAMLIQIFVALCIQIRLVVENYSMGSVLRVIVVLILIGLNVAYALAIFRYVNMLAKAFQKGLAVTFFIAMMTAFVALLISGIILMFLPLRSIFRWHA